MCPVVPVHVPARRRDSRGRLRSPAHPRIVGPGAERAAEPRPRIHAGDAGSQPRAARTSERAAARQHRHPGVEEASGCRPGGPARSASRPSGYACAQRPWMNIVARTSRSASMSRSSSSRPDGRPVGVLDVERQRDPEARYSLDAGDHDAAREDALEDDVDDDRDDQRHQRAGLEQRRLAGVDAVEALQADREGLELRLRRQVDQRLEEVVPRVDEVEDRRPR